MFTTLQNGRPLTISNKSGQGEGRNLETQR